MILHWYTFSNSKLIFLDVNPKDNTIQMAENSILNGKYEKIYCVLNFVLNWYILIS